MKDVTLPLAGVKVVEICNVAAGPFCGMLLADLGAEVIKIENPAGGDTMRAWPPHTGPEADRFSENFASLNRNKQSVSLDLKSSEGKAAVLALASGADVLIENNRPGVLGRLGLGYEDIRAINPRIIYCSISAYGQRGPRAAEGGFDVTVQAISGIMSVTGEEGGSPVKAGIPISDFSAGLYASYAIGAQLRRVAETGIGVHIDVPMVGTSLAFAALQTSEYFGSGNDPVKLGSAHPRNAPYQAFKARDDYFVMAAGTNSLWQKVCELLGREDLLEDPRFATTVLRAKHQLELKAILEEAFSRRDARDLIKMFADAGVPCVPINTYSSAVKDRQVEFMGWVEDLTLPNGVTTKTIGFPLRFDGAAPRIRLNPPKLGQHAALVNDR
ncbi:MAG: CoA transferase [Rhizobiales bacterium]|nr:CoA transferase [Hyphomicrobiales bacterium]